MTALPIFETSRIRPVLIPREEPSVNQNLKVRRVHLPKDEQVASVDVLSVHILSTVLPEGVDGLKTVSTAKLATLKSAGWRLKWLSELAGKVECGALTPEKAFVHFLDTHDASQWLDDNPTLQCLFSTAGMWQRQGRNFLSAAFYGLLLRLGLLEGRDRIVVRCLQALEVLEGRDAACVALAMSTDGLETLRSLWLSEPVECEECDKPSPGRVEWLLSQPKPRGWSHLKNELRYGTEDLLWYYADPASDISLNIRAFELLPHWAELWMDDASAIERLSGFVELLVKAQTNLVRKGYRDSSLRLHVAFTKTWAILVEPWGTFPQMAALAVEMSKICRQANVQHVRSEAFSLVHKALAHIYQVVDGETGRMLRLEWMRALSQWLATGDTEAETSARTLLTVMSVGPCSREEMLCQAKLYLAIGEVPGLHTSYARQCLELTEQVLADDGSEDTQDFENHRAIALLFKGQAMLVLAEKGQTEDTDPVASLCQAREMFRAEIAKSPTSIAREHLATTLLAMTRANLLSLSTATLSERRRLLRQSSEYCQRAMVLSRASNNTLMTCQAMWLLSRVYCNNARPNKMVAYNKALSLALSAMDLLGLTYGDTFVRGEHTGGRSVSECLMRQYLKLVRLLGRYQDKLGTSL